MAALGQIENPKAIGLLQTLASQALDKLKDENKQLQSRLAKLEAQT